MIITITGVGAVSQASKGKAKWDQFTLSYNGPKGPADKVVRSFEQEVFKSLQGVKVGDTLDVQVVKDGEYWKWKGFTVTEAQNDGVKNTVGAATAPVSSKAKVGDWETSEERAKKQVYIVRQSAINASIEYWGLRGDKPSLEQILEVAATFERHVFDQNAGQVAKQPATRAKVTKPAPEAEVIS